MALIVLDPGLHATVQDRGRFGYREWGVPIGGAFDQRSAALANALVNNPSDCAVLELTLAGGAYRAGCNLALALAGAPADARVVSGDLPQRSLAVPTSFSLLAGDRLILGPIRTGARTYLAVKEAGRRLLFSGVDRRNRACKREQFCQRNPVRSLYAALASQSSAQRRPNPCGSSSDPMSGLTRRSTRNSGRPAGFK